ncbi:MAG: fibronectin type III domain-containing protein [Clostridia bacterium]|nr:fibronectin type III domain-containing protein [Clostridia bacterium]
MKKLLTFILAIALFLPLMSGISFNNAQVAAASSHVYMIVTNPGEDMNTQMNVGWHADYTYTGCYVEYTVASDTSFANAKKVNGSYDDNDYLWFYNRLSSSSTSSTRFTTKFLNYGAELTGLTPNTNYIYRICDGAGAYSETYAFKTAGQTEFSMIWLSDMHLSASSSKNTKYVNALKYAESAAKYDIGLYVNTGDVVSCGDKYSWWQEFYNVDAIKKYSYAGTVGNHDLFDEMMDNDSENYTQYWKTGKYFGITANYPDNGYTQTSSRISGYLSGDGYSSYVNSSSDDFIVPSSGSLAGKQITGAKEDLNGRSYWFLYNRILFITFDYYAMTATSEKNTAFNWAYEVIDKNKGKYDYLICYEHLNLIWGDGGTSRYYTDYQNFLDTANVDIFLCGDNHIYFRTKKLLAGAETTDPEKGTYILQAPAITNTSTYPTYTGAKAPYGVSRYSSADYLGSFAIDVDSSGMHFTLGIGTGTGANMAKYETFTIPKKTRYSDAATGIYTAQSALTVRETSDASAKSLTTIPSGTVFEVTAGNGQWGRVRYNGYTGWVNLSGYTATAYTSNVTIPELFEITNVNVGYASSHMVDAYTPTYGSTIANGGWLFSGNVTITGVRDSTGAYKVTAQDTSSNAKNTTAIPSNGCVLLINTAYPSYASLMEKLAVGKYFTLDSNSTMVYTANPGEANVTPSIPGTEPDPEELTLIDGADYTIGDYVTCNAINIRVDSFKAQFANTTVKVFDGNGVEVTGSALVGTNYTVSCYSSSDTVADDTMTISVLFDLDGNGAISASDCLIMKTFVKSSVALEGAFLTAADCNTDGSPNATDYTFFKLTLSKQ